MNRFGITLLCAALCASLAGEDARADAPRRCAVEAVDGPAASLWRDGVWRALAPGPLPPTEVKLRTGPDTRVEILCDDGLRVTLGVDAEANLERLTGAPNDARGVILQLIEGAIGIIAPSRAVRAIELRAPRAIAAARSTEWLGVARDGDSAFFVREGAILVRAEPPAEGAVVLEQGEGVDAGASGLGPVRTWPAERIAAVGEALGFRWR